MYDVDTIVNIVLNILEAEGVLDKGRSFEIMSALNERFTGKPVESIMLQDVIEAVQQSKQ